MSLIILKFRLIFSKAFLWDTTHLKDQKEKMSKNPPAHSLIIVIMETVQCFSTYRVLMTLSSLSGFTP